jgi:hypothetical protein
MIYFKQIRILFYSNLMLRDNVLVSLIKDGEK